MKRPSDASARGTRCLPGLNIVGPDGEGATRSRRMAADTLKLHFDAAGISLACSRTSRRP